MDVLQTISGILPILINFCRLRSTVHRDYGPLSHGSPTNGRPHSTPYHSPPSFETRNIRDSRTDLIPPSFGLEIDGHRHDFEHGVCVRESGQRLDCGLGQTRTHVSADLGPIDQNRSVLEKRIRSPGPADQINSDLNKNLTVRTESDHSISVLFAVRGSLPEDLKILSAQRLGSSFVEP